jgi:hypothetical protein
MFRPELDDDLKTKTEEIIDNSVSVPLPSDELSFNQQLRIIISAVYEEVEERDDAVLIVDDHYLNNE